LTFKARQFEPALTIADLGNPIDGSTSYRLCVYGRNDELIGGLLVDRAGDSCGRSARPCWRTVDAGAYDYRDPRAAADGVRRMVAKSGPIAEGSLRLKARNRAKKGLDAFPRGFTEGLDAAERATVQLIISDGGCVSASLDQIRRANGTKFKGKSAP